MFDWNVRIRKMDEAGVNLAIISLSSPSVFLVERELAQLVSYVDPDRVMYGSDYPFSLGDMPGILGRVNRLAAPLRDAVRGGNAARLFGLHGGKAAQ